MQAPVAPALNPNQTSREDKVPVLSKVAYGLGTALDMWGHWLYPSVAFAVFNIYLGVSPALVGTALMLNRLADALSDPFFGWLSDNTRTRWGRRRPYLLFGAIAAGIGLPMLFLLVSPHWSQREIFAYMVISSLIYVPMMSSFNMPFQSLGAEMTPDYNERTSVMSYKGAIQKVTEIANFSALQVATWAGVHFASSPAASSARPNTLLGMQIYTCALGAIMATIGIIMFFSIRERYYDYVLTQKQEKVKLKEAFFETLKCKPFRIQLLFTMAFALGNSMVGTLGYYATVYVVCRGNETSLVGRRREVHAALEHRVKETVERFLVALHDFSEALRGAGAEIDAEHAADSLCREHHAVLFRRCSQTFGQGKRIGA